MEPLLEIYIHIPFCIQKCHYCDFLSAPASTKMQADFSRALIKEIRAWAASGDCRGRAVPTIFFGGGTPSILPARILKTLLSEIKKHFNVAENAEISIEVNPGTVDEQALNILFEAGFNRLSIGLQSANDEELKLLGRIHDYSAFLNTFKAARAAGFTNINVDIISSIPGQSFESYTETLERVLALYPEHISAYSLIIEEGTPFFDAYAMDDERRKRGDEPLYLPSEETERKMYYETAGRLKKAGFERYEISNYARPGYECRHNLGYWSGTEYIGLGLGASSYLKTEGFPSRRFINENELGSYCRYWLDESGSTPVEKEVQFLTQAEEEAEFMILGLRRIRGIDTSQFCKCFKKDILSVYGDVIERLASQGLLASRGTSLYLTEKGIDVSNYVLSEFL